MRHEIAPPLARGRYRLTEVLGAGGMAVVYRAFDTRLDVPRAIKVLKPELDVRARERFDTEARTMAKLHHKNVVLVHDVADDGDRAYLVMELIEGGSIADRIQAFGPLPPQMACNVVIAVLAGLDAAHTKGVVHRDIKPHNIMVAEDGTPKVTDFGIAQVSDISTTRTGAVIGTWAYMAPEQRADAKAVDARADVFAVGCALYNMVTNREPFDLYNRELHDELMAGVPEPLREIIARATRYKPEDRYPTARDMLQALEAILDALPEDPPDTPPLGVSLEGRRTEFVPTLLGSIHDSTPASAERARSFDIEPMSVLGVVISAVAMLFVMVGGVAGLVFLVLLGLSAPARHRTSVAEPVGVAIPAAGQPDAGGPDAAAEVEPEVEPEPEPEAEPEPAVELEPVPPVAAPVVPGPAAQPSPQPAAPRPARPRPAEAPPPATGELTVLLSSRPLGLIGWDGGNYKRAPREEKLTPGTYDFEFEANGQVKRFPVRIEREGQAVCWDFTTDARCR